MIIYMGLFLNNDIDNSIIISVIILNCQFFNIY